MTDPIALSEFFDLLPLAEGFVWRERRSDNLEGMGGGATIGIEVADPLWSSDVVVDWSAWPKARELAARIRALRGSQGTFLITNPIARYPAGDPTGSILGDAEVTILAIDDDNQRVSFAGLPEDYALTWGDFGEVAFSTDPVRHYLFEIHGDASADAEGETDLVEIYPPVWPGITAGASVNFISPATPVFIVPNTLKEGSIRSAIVNGMSFTVLQRP